MNFKYTGVFIAILILLGMLIMCHLRNSNMILTPIKSDFINLGFPKYDKLLEFNKISYIPGKQQIPCEIVKQANFPCNQIKNCNTSGLSLDMLSDSELAILYKEAYESAGLELMKRILDKKISV